MSRHSSTHAGDDPKRVEVKGAAPAAPDAVVEGAVSAPDSAADLATLITTLEGEATHWREFAARAQAEFDNTRKRLETRHADAVTRAGERLVEALVPVVDDIDYALRHASETGNEMHDGLAAIRTKLVGVFASEGVEVVDPMGLPFDHDTATAVKVVDDPSVPDGTVVEVFQRGYRMGTRVIRPAMVVVSAGGPTAGKSAT